MTASSSRRQALATLALASASLLGPPPLVERAGAFSFGGASLLRELDSSIEHVFKENTPSVVFISTYTQARSPFGLDATIEVQQGTGSGIVWDSTGTIVTNYHVIRTAQDAKVTVTGEGGKRQLYDARFVGANPDKDIAVLQLLPLSGESSVHTTPVRVGRSAGLHVGQLVFAIGNPFGLDHTLTMGVVSGLGREMLSPSRRPISNVIQTDAAINPGNSGGVLLDIDGKLIGMNTAIYSTSGTSAGIGFAIPSDTLSAQVRSILTKGGATRAVLGIAVLSGPQLQALGIENGVLVLRVTPGSEAAIAGLRGSERDASGAVDLGDVIVECDGKPINSEIDLFRALDTHQPGETVKVVVMRGYRDVLTQPDARGKGARRDLGGLASAPLERKELRVRLSSVDIAVPISFPSALPSVVNPSGPLMPGMPLIPPSL